MFDLEKIKKDSDLTVKQLRHIEEIIKQDYPYDEMMFELHFLRVIKAIKKGWITIEYLFAESHSYPSKKLVTA